MCHMCTVRVYSRVIQFGVPSKVRVRKLSRILTNPKNAVCELVKVRRTSSPYFEFWGPNLQLKMQERALDGRQTF